MPLAKPRTRYLSPLFSRSHPPAPAPAPAPAPFHHRHPQLKRLYAGQSSPYVQHPTQRSDPSDPHSPLLSRVSGPTDKPLSTLTLGQFWSEIVTKFAERPALISRHEPASQHGEASSSSALSSGSDAVRWSFAEMNQHIRKLIKGLLGIGVRKGDRVGVVMMNSSAYGALQWALAEIGAIMVTLNPAYSPGELKKALRHVGASTLIIVPSLRGSNYVSALNDLLPSLKGAAHKGDKSIIEEESLPELRRLVLVDNLDNRPKGWESTSVLGQQGKTFRDAVDELNGRCIDYRELLKDSSARDYEKPDFMDVINLQLTSGTTGRPKAVALSSHNLLNNGISIGDTLKLTPSDVLCNVPPLFHCFGLVLGNLAAWTHGSSVVYAAEGFDPVRSLRAASEERCTALHGVPTHFIAQLEVLESLQEHYEDPSKYPLPQGVREGERFDLTPLRTGLTSGSTVPIELMKRIMDPKKMGAKEQTVVYGQTETSPVSFGCDIDAPVERRCETVGRIYPHAHAKIVDPNDPEGKVLPVGTAGELCTAGYIVMKGYYQEPEKTAEVLQRHQCEPEIQWMRTGDVAVMDEEGYVRIVGRSKDIIIRGGENLFPVTIENCIDLLPGVATNAVIAVPDEKYGETVGVFISRGHGTKVDSVTIRKHVKENVSGQSAPAWVWYLGEDGVPAEFPKTASGKIQKVILREWAKELVAQGQGKTTS
ncbi:acetyl-CoA synthetase-like protein [Violaceomyces palustris]|uniref:Acetyl-CoA synthetase-like protein n=1 Tax=Violaceomyces palustris TaxID=1673888 RepID=A0ACD0NZ35_9BASI|nr:acetyl-CoA synthetase-like protein [Violaceomyces palustris]